MSPIERSLAEPMMLFELEQHLEDLTGDESYVRSGRLGRTLARSGRLRLVLVALRAGVEIGTHHADSPMTIQLTRGRLGFTIRGKAYEMGAGQVLYFGPGEAHDIRALEDSGLLLTISAIGDDDRMS